MDCSDAAKMLIDQMKEHPEEFRGYAGKFTAMLDMAREALQGPHRNVRMSMRDAEAITAAAETHLYEVWLAEDVLTMIMRPKQEDEPEKVYATPVKAGLWQGAVPSAIYSNGNIASNTMANIGSSNTSTSQYIEQAYRMEMEKLKMEQERREMREREDFKRREDDYAMRNTKPFKNYL
jgi:hypothetical protein